MIDGETRLELSQRIAERIAQDKGLLDELRSEVTSLRDQVRQIKPRSVTSLAFVATDGGNNQLRFDPFLVQLIRVVDSSNNSYVVDVVTPESDIQELSDRHLADNGSHLGALMRLLGVADLWHLSPMIPAPKQKDRSPSWVQVYRELTEWATLLHLLRERTYGTDTLIVFDGLLRSKVFSGTLFARMLAEAATAIATHKTREKRNIYLVGVAKHSKVLDRYQLAMTLENILTVRYPAYVEVPRELEAKAYVWPEYARGASDVAADGTTKGSKEANKFVGGKMHLVKFGSSPSDPLWPVDIFEPQAPIASTIIGSLLADAIDGFPVPHYPRCLQKAHENAALVDFDFDILQDEIYKALRTALGDHAPKLDAFMLRTNDVAARRY
jgi:hypothetical protein